MGNTASFSDVIDSGMKAVLGENASVPRQPPKYLPGGVFADTKRAYSDTKRAKRDLESVEKGNYSDYCSITSKAGLRVSYYIDPLLFESPKGFISFILCFDRPFFIILNYLLIFCRPPFPPLNIKCRQHI